MSVYFAVTDGGSPSLSPVELNHLYSRIAKAVDVVRLAKRGGALVRQEMSSKAGNDMSQVSNDTGRSVEKLMEATARTVCKRQLGAFSLRNLGMETGVEPAHWLEMNDTFTSIKCADTSPSTSGAKRLPFEVVVGKTFDSSRLLSPEEQLKAYTATLKEKLNFADNCLRKRKKGKALDYQLGKWMKQRLWSQCARHYKNSTQVSFPQKNGTS